MYLYVRRKFNWNAKTFGRYIGFYGLLGMFAQYVAVPYLSGKLHLHDTTIGDIHIFPVSIKIVTSVSALIAICGVIVQHFIACFTPITMSYFIYVGGVMSFLSVCITTTCR